jgi:hypothetical protein
MRTSHSSRSSARRVSSWLMVVLGLAAYVGLLYGLTMLPLQLEVPLPHWAIAIVPPLVYGLLVLLCVAWPSPLGWLVGTALLSGLHLLLGMARSPISAFLDPSLAGRPLPWMLPPPLPELVGLILLLVPLRDVLRARPRSARERVAAGRATASVRGRTTPARPMQPAPGYVPSESPSSSPVEVPLVPVAAPAPPPVPVAPPISVPPPVDPEVAEEARRRRIAVGAERRREMQPQPQRPVRRSDVVLRIALDRIMGQLPPGTFLAPEDEVAASLRDPGYLLIPGPLVVTQLSEGIALVAWSDIVDQFPSRLVGLDSQEIEAHLGDGLRLPLDEVIAQLPHDLFVADTPEVELSGIERIPVPFHPVEEAAPTPRSTPQIAAEPHPVPMVEQPWATPVARERPILEAPVVEARVEPMPTPVPEPAVRIEEPVVPAPVLDPVPAPIHVSEPEPAVAPAPPAVDTPTVRISFGRIAAELPAEAFRSPLDEIGARMPQPNTLLVPLAQILPQLGEGLIRVGWDVIAPQFPREQLALSDADMTERLSNGINLPIDEVIRQISPDLFMTGGPAADVSGLESFPAPFQPLLSDPAPEPPPVAAVKAAPPAVVAATPLAPAVPAAVRTVGAESVREGAPVPDRLVETPVAAEPLPPSPERPVVPEPVTTDAALIVAAPAPPDVVEPLPITPSSVPIVVEPVHVSTPPILSTPPSVVEPPAPAVPEVRQPVEVRPEPAPATVKTEPVVVMPAPALEPERTPAPIAAPGPRRDEPVVKPVAVPPTREWRVAPPLEAGPIPPVADSAAAGEARRILGILAPIASFEVSVQPMEGVTVFAMAAPAVAPETALAATGLALPLLTDRRAPWSLDQITLRGSETALVLTPLGRGRSVGPVLATAAPRGGALALLEILCRRVGAEGGRAATPAAAPLERGRNLAPAAVPDQLTRCASSLTAFGPVTASVLRDTEGEGVFYFFLPVGTDVPAVGAFAQDLQAVVRKAAGSGAVFRTAVLRSGNTLVVIQPEEVGHGRSIVVVAGGDVTRPGLAYRQVERATAMLAQA